MRVKVESYLEKGRSGRERWAYALVAGRKDDVISSANGFASATEARAAGDALIASLAVRAMAKKANTRGVGR
ncbi:hypothetical protein [Chitinibacter sp. S2-10]|uniref:hypothetical protein n=1 Tax=Chitinibacter sp. S2-10 TaxID=3373597 RepID=UPI003977A511